MAHRTLGPPRKGEVGPRSLQPQGKMDPGPLPLSCHGVKLPKLSSSKFDFYLHDLRNIADPDGGAPGPRAAGDIDLGLSLAYISPTHRVKDACEQIEWEELAVMRVAAEEEIDPFLHRFIDPGRPMVH